MPNPFAESKKPSKTKRFFNVLKVIFFSRIPMNLLLLAVLIILSIVGFESIKPDQTPTGQVVLQQECPECVCENQECEPDCELCPVKTKVETEEVIKYKCPRGDLVEDLNECKGSFPNVSVEYSGTVEGITFAIDSIEYEKDEDDSGFVTKVGYTIINNGDLPIVPKLEVKVYEEWTLKVSKTVANKVINPEIVVMPNDYVQREDRVRIYFQGQEQTLRLLLVDSLPTIEREVLAVTRDFDLDYVS